MQRFPSIQKKGLGVRGGVIYTKPKKFIIMINKSRNMVESLDFVVAPSTFVEFVVIPLIHELTYIFHELINQGFKVIFPMLV